MKTWISYLPDVTLVQFTLMLGESKNPDFEEMLIKLHDPFYYEIMDNKKVEIFNDTNAMSQSSGFLYEALLKECEARNIMRFSND